MDNIVDYLVAGFFIISFLASIFKKKKVKETSDKNIEPISDSGQQRVSERKQKAKSPFDDFFKVINEELANAKKEVSSSEVDEYYEQAMQNSDETEIKSQNTIQQTKPASLIHETVRTKKEETISIKSYHDSIEFSKALHESKKARDIKKSLSETDSIRDFIIINEILGKPKALQR